MHKIYALIILFVCTATIMAAQETPKFEFFGGYSFVHADAGLGRHANLNGWNSSVAYNFNKWVGIVLDGSGAYGSTQVGVATDIFFICPTDPTSCPPPLFLRPVTIHQQVHTYSIGPQFSYRTDSRFTPFAHVLFGGGYASSKSGNFTAANGSHVITLGGGVDVRLNSLLALRTQADLVQTHFFRQPHDGLRVSTGVVFRFGKK